MKRFINTDQRGDTIVEVLLATVVLSVIVAGAYTLTNRASQLNQEAFERTQVSNLLQGQAELVRASRDTFISTDTSAPESRAWTEIENSFRQTNVAPLGNDCVDINNIGARRTGSVEFYMDLDGSGNPDPVGGIKTEQTIYRVWTEAEDNGSYWDIHVFGCWEGLSVDIPLQTSIVMRLDDPR